MSPNELQFPQMMKKLHTRLLVMYVSTSQALENAINCLTKADRQAAMALAAGDSEIDALEKEIDDMALALLVRAQPVAGDLRLIVGALGIINDLERIGDEAVVIAERVAQAGPEECAFITQMTLPLLELAKSSMQQAFDSFNHKDVQAAVELCKTYDNASQSEIRMIQEVVDRLAAPDKPAPPGALVRSIITCRSLVRVCRRTANLAEQTVFIYTGRNIKHTDAREIPAPS